MVIRVSDPPKGTEEEEERFLFTLRARGQVLETTDENVDVPAGVTHILLKEEGKEPRLIRKRFSI